MTNCNKKTKSDCIKLNNECTWCDGKTRKYCRKKRQSKNKIKTVKTCKKISANRCSPYLGLMDKDCKLSNKNRCVINKTTRIISWNVNGIRSKSQNLIANKELNLDSPLNKMLEQYNPDILCLGETKCQCKHTDDLKKILPFEYQAWSCSTQKLGYSGIAILSKVAFKNLGKIPGLEADKQGRNLLLEFPKFYLAYVYVPNSGTNETYRRDTWDPAIIQFLTNYKKKRKPLIYCGDLNVVHTENDIYNPEIIKKGRSPGVKPFERDNFTKMLNVGYTDSIRKLNKNKKLWTWWDARSKARLKDRGWRLDYFLVNKEKIVQSGAIYKEILGSDHCPIGINIKN